MLYLLEARMYTHTHTYSTYDGEDSIFNKWYQENWTATCKENETEPLSNIHKHKMKMY